MIYPCNDCGQSGLIAARGLCSGCVEKLLRRLESAAPEAPCSEPVAWVSENDLAGAKWGRITGAALSCKQEGDRVVPLYRVSAPSPPRQTEADKCPECGHGNRLNGRIVHGPLCTYGDKDVRS